MDMTIETARATIASKRAQQDEIDARELLEELEREDAEAQRQQQLDTLRLQREAADLVPVQFRGPAHLAMGDGGRRRMGRSAQLQHRPLLGEHQHGRFRLGLPPAEPEPERRRRGARQRRRVD